jgi:HEAT repeat protein
MSEKKQQLSFEKVISALLDTNTPFSPSYLHRFSDLEGNNLEALKKVWSQIESERRFHLVEDLEELADTDTVVSIESVARLGLEDKEPRIRLVALRMLWEYDDIKLIPVFINMMERDIDMEVRAGAAQALGHFIYLGELEEIPESARTLAEQSLLKVPSSASEKIRRRVLESLGYSSHEAVHEMIQKAFESGDEGWIASSVTAMGRSADPYWEKMVLKMLDHPSNEIQLEAIRAAGELEIKSARQPLLMKLANIDSLDVDIYAATAWSLSQIGGDRVRKVLEALVERAEDDEEVEFLEEALENLEFTENYTLLALLDVAPEKDLSHTIDVKEKSQDEDDLDEDNLRENNLDEDDLDEDDLHEDDLDEDDSDEDDLDENNKSHLN